MQEREAGFEGFDNLIARLNTLNGRKWSVASILDEILPEQRNLSEARYLLEPRLPIIKDCDDRKRKTTRTRDDRIKCNRSVVPFRPTLVSPRSLVASPVVGTPTKQALVGPFDKCAGLLTSNKLRGHVLSLWEDKFRLKCLAIEDVLFLLAHPNVACTLESASFLREMNLTYDQVMEMEMALVMLRRQEEWVHAHSRKALPTSLCDKLARNAWIHGRVLPIARTSSSMLPEVIVCKRGPPRATQTKLPQNQPRIPSKTNNVLASAKSPASSKVEICPPDIREWVRDHCMEEVTRSISMRKQFAVEKLSIIISRSCHESKRRRFTHWRQQMMWMICRQHVRRFCRLKCALFVLQISRKRLECVVFRLWGRWMANIAYQHEVEATAAAVAIQSWVRGMRGKHTAAVYHLHQAATLIQAGWRGFHSRKMLKRRKRFLAYDVASHRVQRFYHSYIFRVRCAVWMKQQKAARVITRAFVHYIEKKRDFITWCHHLVKYHAAIAIQLWMRRTRKRIARAQARRDKRANARLVLFNFFRYVQFTRFFGKRVTIAIKRRTAAAVLLQNAYRAKQARAQFYELKVRLEDQRRQEILTHMWNNAYATTIQRWWWKRKRLQNRQQLFATVTFE